MKVLLADDDPNTLRLVGHALRKMGHAVVTATDGTEASEKFLAEGFPVVVTDWEMPGLNGIELCRLIRNAKLPVYTYIIFLTSRHEKQHLIEALDAGADDFISKPFDIQEMQVRLRAAERVVRLERELRDVNKDLRSMNERLLHMSRMDPLMEIGNRLDFEEKVTAFHERAAAHNLHYALVMCDVDHFKIFNDTYGHQSGDDILRRVASAVRATLRREDDAFRYGGEEILLYLHRQDLPGAAAAAERVRRGVAEQEFSTGESNEKVRVTISCGVALYPLGAQPGGDWSSIVEQADRALYEAKNRGRNRVVAAVPDYTGGLEFKSADQVLGRQPSPEQSAREAPVAAD